MEGNINFNPAGGVLTIVSTSSYNFPQRVLNEFSLHLSADRRGINFSVGCHDDYDFVRRRLACYKVFGWEVIM